MAENVYEGMFILDSNRYGRDPDAVSGRIAEMIQRAGGEMLVSRLWEERRLAFPIKGHRRGTYWLTYFRLDSGRLADVGRQCQLNDSILRRLFLRVDPRIVDTLVTHARAALAATTGGDASENAHKSDTGRKQHPGTTAKGGGANDGDQDADAEDDTD